MTEPEEPPDAPDVPPSARRVQVAPERLERWLAGFAERHGPLTWTTGRAHLHATGADGARLWIRIPFPPLVGADAADPAADAGTAARPDPAAAALLAHVLRPRRVGVLLVRRGGHAAGVFDGTRLVASKVGSSYVQGTTKAGGWSQQRFARRRANQARAAFADAADAAVRVLLPESARLDALVCGGDRTAVEAALADVRLDPVRHLVTGTLLAVPDPRLRVLERTPEQFRSVPIRIDP